MIKKLFQNPEKALTLPSPGVPGEGSEATFKFTDFS
jgi:hypothetical protein